MKIDLMDFRVRSGKNFDLSEWPTTVKPFYKSKKQYEELLEKHVKEPLKYSPIHKLRG